MPLKDLVVYLGNRRASGVLELQHEATRKRVFLRDGRVVNASSNLPREYFGQFLINAGHITEDQFARAYATQRETNVFLGKVLAMIGLVSERTIETVLALKFRETLLDAFSWTAGEFTYDPDAGAPALGGLEASVELLDVHREGEFRETAWEAIRAAFPSGAVRLSVDRSKLPEIKPGSLDERLVGLIEDDLSIDDMLLTLHASDFLLYQRLYALYRLEAVLVRGEVVAEPPAEELGPVGVPEGAPVHELVGAARDLVATGRAREAEAYVRRLGERAPEDPEAAALAAEVEAARLAQLRAQLIAQPQVPSVQVPPARLKALALTPAERYLLSRMDGQRDVGAIIHVAPLKELEALRYVEALVESGTVRLTPRRG